MFPVSKTCPTGHLTELQKIDVQQIMPYGQLTGSNAVITPPYAEGAVSDMKHSQAVKVVWTSLQHDEQLKGRSPLRAAYTRAAAAGIRARLNHKLLQLSSMQHEQLPSKHNHQCTGRPQRRLLRAQRHLEPSVKQMQPSFNCSRHLSLALPISLHVSCCTAHPPHREMNARQRRFLST